VFSIITEQIKALHRDQRGQGMAEYALIIVAVALLAIGGYKLLGAGINTKINEAKSALE